MTTIGSLFTGYGGLDHAVEAVTGGRTIWRSDIDPGACKVIAHHWPDEPNLGDITAVDWSAVEPVDVLAGGFPCQDVSTAGKRAGLIRYGEGNRSGLWAEMARAIDILRPSLVVAENVRGLLSAKADAHPDVFDCLACVADTNDKPMRALGAVLGDLAQLGYDAAWRVVRASDIGAPHQRARVFVIAWPADANRAGLAQWCQQPARDERATAERGHSDVADADRDGLSQLRGELVGQRDADGCGGAHGVRNEAEPPARVALMPTPAARLGDGSGMPGADVARQRMATRRNLEDALALLPTPSATNPNDGESFEAVQPERWGKYADAVARWEALTRPAPEPTETGPRGGQRLSPEFVEWMMGLPAGHVTGVPGLSRNDQLKMLGNGVVPQQAAAALRVLLDAVAVAV